MPASATQVAVLRLSSIVDQDIAAQRLEEMIARGRLPHAMLFFGPDSAGKMRAAMILAQMLMCLDRKERDLLACDTCAGCLKVKEGVHADVHIVATEARSLKVDEIRTAARSLQLRPMEGRAKVLIIFAADKMTIEAQNALLKTLEEPPGTSYIILASEKPRTILPTVLSRCQRVPFRPVTGPALLSPEQIARRDRAAGIDLRVYPGRRAVVHDALTVAGEIADDRAELGSLVDSLVVWLHDQIIVASGASLVSVTNFDRQSDLEGLANERGLAMVLARARAALYAKRRLALPYNLNATMIAEQLCLALAGQVAVPEDPDPA